MPQSSTIFSKIIAREIPATIIAENEHIIVIKDINPQAPIHFLIISKKLFNNIYNADQDDLLFGLYAFQMAYNLSHTIENADNFKLIMNNGSKAGQCVFHAHIHFLAGY